MKKILITGENSYIGSSFKSFLLTNYPKNYQVDEINVKGDDWKNYNFALYDVVLHVAGIAHIKETKRNQALYYKVNRDLAVNVAKKAKQDNVKQFIFLSSMSVYGIDVGEISIHTKANPKNAYGKSKFEAEKKIKKMNADDFAVTIIRPPMVYGPGCKGNYSKLAKLAKITPIFPDFKNQRSMIFIDNLSIFIKETIDNGQSGLYLPQDEKYVSTTNLVIEIARNHNKKIILTKVFNPVIYLTKSFAIVSKVFGDLIYINPSTHKNLGRINFKKSISITESNKN